jgi:putative two-component system response regulator
MGASPAAARQIKSAAAMHDAGKLRIPESILNKPGKLSAREYGIMKTHTILGAEMLSTVQGALGAMAMMTALYHHEHWDGNGYWGVPAHWLPGYVNITAICDVFTALIAERPYKGAWPPQKAVDYIQSKAGTQFSPDLVSAFLSLIRNDRRVPDIFEPQRGQRSWQL